jgi:hypothetical protein
MRFLISYLWCRIAKIQNTAIRFPCNIYTVLMSAHYYLTRTYITSLLCASRLFVLCHMQVLLLSNENRFYKVLTSETLVPIIEILSRNACIFWTVFRLHIIAN